MKYKHPENTMGPGKYFYSTLTFFFAANYFFSVIFSRPPMGAYQYSRNPSQITPRCLSLLAPGVGFEPTRAQGPSDFHTRTSGLAIRRHTWLGDPGVRRSGP